MAGENGQTPSDLIQRICRDARLYHPFQLLRLLEKEGARLGEAKRPGREFVRLRQEPSLAFAPSAVAGASWDEERERVIVSLYGPGLLGPNGAMPLYVTEFIDERNRHHRDTTLEAFVNIFQHRLLSLLFRGWALNHPAIDFERKQESRFAGYIAATIGLGMEGLRDRDQVGDWPKLHFAGRLGGQTRSAEGIEAILSEYFEVPAHVETFCGQWIDLPRDSQCSLGGDNPHASILGKSAIAGTRMWETQLKFRIDLGPMELDQYKRLLPGGSAFKQLKDWVHFYVGLEFFWDLRLILQRDEVPEIRLGGDSALGWTCWLKTRPLSSDAADLTIAGEEATITTAA